MYRNSFTVKTKLRDGSGHRRYRYLYEDVDRHGNVRVYFWRGKGHPKIRIRALPGDAEFDREYQQAFGRSGTGSTATTADPSSFRWLCERYYVSPKFLSLAEATRRVRRRVLEDICRQAGTFRYAAMRPQDVAKLRDQKATTPEAANSRVKALRQLFSWASDPEYRLADSNPARDVKFLRPNNPDGFEPWAEADVAKFEARHSIGTKPRLALDLLLCTGVRISDAVRLGPQMERDNKLYFTEAKGRARKTKHHVMPVLPALRVSIDAIPTGHLVYLATENGQPYSVKGFGNWFSRQIRMAGISGKSAHGLRKLAAIRWAEMGATEAQLQAWFGWTTAKQSAVYTRAVNRERLEAETARLANDSFPPSDSKRSRSFPPPQKPQRNQR